jgi:hypothetical protein
MDTYGLFFVLASGEVLEGLAWIAAGVLLQVASGVFGHPDERGTGLANPFRVLNQALRRVRNRVESWDERE